MCLYHNLAAVLYHSEYIVTLSQDRVIIKILMCGIISWGKGVDAMDSLLLFVELNWVPLLCIVLGIVFVIIEMNIPGFGVPGIVGVILLIVGVVLCADTLLQALIMIIVIIAILGVALALVLRSASKGRLSKHLILNDSLEGDAKFSAEEDLSYFIGSEGTTLTPLRPSGTVDFSGVRLDVVTEGEFILKNTEVTIIKIEGNRIVVKQIPSV